MLYKFNHLQKSTTQPVAPLVANSGTRVDLLARIGSNLILQVSVI